MYPRCSYFTLYRCTVDPLQYASLRTSRYATPVTETRDRRVFEPHVDHYSFSLSSNNPPTS